MRPITKNSALLSAAYFPPVQYVSKFLLYEKLSVEACEYYQSQSYRNRCVISGPNGLQKLSIPVKKDGRKKVPVRDVQIDYKTPWQKDHWRSIENAYKSSPFFEFYKDAFLPFYQKKRFRFLFDFNLETLNTVLEEIEIPVRAGLTDAFRGDTKADDYRFSIHPKPARQKPDSTFSAKPYTQVFSDRFDFLPNLSILDLLFNQGPNTEFFLKTCIAS